MVPVPAEGGTRQKRQPQTSGIPSLRQRPSRAASSRLGSGARRKPDHSRDFTPTVSHRRCDFSLALLVPVCGVEEPSVVRCAQNRRKRVRLFRPHRRSVPHKLARAGTMTDVAVERLTPDQLEEIREAFKVRGVGPRGRRLPVLTCRDACRSSSTPTTPALSMPTSSRWRCGRWGLSRSATRFGG